MNRLLSTFCLDVRLQFRNDFYYAALFVSFFVAAAFYYLIPQEFMGYAIPIFLLTSLQATTFYFVAALILLEKGEGTLEGIVVTPLRTSEYLLSKLSTLTMLAVLENAIIIGLVFGFQFRWTMMLAGVVLMSLLYILAGIIMATRYDSFTDFLFPSIVCIVGLQLPALHYFGVWPNWILYLVPTQAPLLLLRDAFDPIGASARLYALAYSLVVVGAGFWWAVDSFSRFVVRKEGSER